MKKKLIASVLALATCFAFGGALAGCSGKDGAAGANGTNGANGKSAYQIWLDQGNTGSEVDFLNSLKGSGSATCDHENMMKAELMDPVTGKFHKSTYNAETEEWEYTPGTVLNVCVDCGYSKITEEVYHVMKNTERASTCTEKGFKGSECLICDYNEGEELDLGEHVVDETKIYPLVEQDYRNLCEEGGLVATVCTECKTAFTAELEATGHTWDVSELVYDASANVLKGVCKNYCKETKTIALPATDDGYVIKLPSCKTGAAQEKVYSIYVNEKGQLSKEAAEGYTLIEIKKVPAVACHTVVVDGKTYEMNQDVYALNGENNYAAAIKEFSNGIAKCKDDVRGSGYFVCDECGDEISVITKRIHEYDEVTVTTPAQCTVDGVAKGKCIHCETLNENLPVEKLGHSPAYTYVKASNQIQEYCAREGCGALIALYNVEGEPVEVPSTCEVQGTITFTAILANGEKVEVTNKLPLAPHKVTVDGVDYVMDKTIYPMNGEDNYAAAIKEFSNAVAHCANGNGNGRFTCTVCGAEELVVTSREHVAVEGTDKVNVVPATCTTDGSYQIDCQNCEGLATVIVPALGHKYEYTLTKAGDIFTLSHVCKNEGCGEAGSIEVALRAEGETEGVVYTKVTATECGKESYDFYQYYNEDGVILATLKLNVIPEPHKVIVDGKTYVMDKEPDESYDINEYSFIKEFNNSKATCGSAATNGQGRYTCSLCEEEYLVATSVECNYDFDAEDVVVVEAGCTIAGTVTGKCTACGETGTKEIPAKGHTLVATATADIYGNVTASVKCSVENCDGNRDDVAVSVELPNLFAKDADDKAYYAVKPLIAESCTNAGEDEYSITWTVTVDGKDYAVDFVIKYTVDATGHYDAEGVIYTYYSEEEVTVRETDDEGKLWDVTYKVTVAHSAFICDDCGNMFETGSTEVAGSRVEIKRVELQ